ncbi:hypothetical protein KAJ87_01325 [Candidatus Pacearchaeota archaeon]|nr:hypothetical protein [Candidatus Pacearchaeota archaeon]
MKKKRMTSFTKTKIFTGILCLLVIIIVMSVQLIGQESVNSGCSYLDPITMDLLAFSIAIFLIIEGVYRISEHKNMGIKKQLTRSIRIAIGCGIMTIHILQFLAK